MFLRDFQILICGIFVGNAKGLFVFGWFFFELIVLFYIIQLLNHFFGLLIYFLYIFFLGFFLFFFIVILIDFTLLVFPIVNYLFATLFFYDFLGIIISLWIDSFLMGTISVWLETFILNLLIGILILFRRLFFNLLYIIILSLAVLTNSTYIITLVGRFSNCMISDSSCCRIRIFFFFFCIFGIFSLPFHSFLLEILFRHFYGCLNLIFSRFFINLLSRSCTNDCNFRRGVIFIL